MTTLLTVANERAVQWELALLLRLVGLATVLGLLALIASGTWLMFFYQPTAASAWDDIDSLQRQIEWGLWVRQLHRWLVPLVMIPAVMWVIMFAAARMGRNSVLAAIAVGAIVIGAASGLFLPWDQLALWSVTTGTNITGFSAVFDDEVKFVLVDGVVVSPAAMRFRLMVHLLAGLVAVVAAAIAAVSIRRTRDVLPPPGPPSR